MNDNNLVGIIYSTAILLPVILIAIHRLYELKCFLALSIYYLLGFFNTLITQNILIVKPDFQNGFSTTFSLLEAPLLLTFLMYFSYSSSLTKQIRYAILGFILFETVVIAVMGYNRNSLSVITGPGLLMIISLSAWFFVRQVKIATTHGKSVGKALLTSSFLFVSGCYGFIYIMHYIFRIPGGADENIIYLISSALSVLVVSAGIIIENKRIRRLKELLVTRQELQVLYRNN